MPTTVQMMAEFLTNGTFVVPAGVEGVFLTMIGGGSSGAPTYQNQAGAGGGGGSAGEVRIRFPVKTTPGASIPVVIGAGGVTATVIFTANPGGDTSFGSVVALGAQGGTNFTKGGGAGGGDVGTPGFPPGVYGLSETPADMGGSGGGKGGVANINPLLPGVDGNPGRGSGGYPIGGAGGALNGPYGGGGGGAGTLWGPGGAGGRGNGQGTVTGGVPSSTNGLPAPAGSYGAGGGGAGGCNSAFSGRPVWGGAGAPGYCLVEWYEEIP